LMERENEGRKGDRERRDVPPAPAARSASYWYCLVSILVILRRLMLKTPLAYHISEVA